MMKIELCNTLKGTSKDDLYLWCDAIDSIENGDSDGDGNNINSKEGKVIKLFKSFVGLFD